MTEMNEMITRGVFRVATPWEQKNKIGFKSKIAFRITTQMVSNNKKINIDPNLEVKLIQILKFKARLVACGYSQILGIHYSRNNSPTVSYNPFLIVLQIALMYNWHHFKLDIGNAYLKALLKEDLYI